MYDAVLENKSDRDITTATLAETTDNFQIRRLPAIMHFYQSPQGKDHIKNELAELKQFTMSQLEKIKKIESKTVANDVRENSVGSKLHENVISLKQELEEVLSDLSNFKNEEYEEIYKETKLKQSCNHRKLKTEKPQPGKR